MSSLSVTVTSYFYRFLVILAILAMIGYSAYLISDTKIWRTEENDPQDDIVHRVQARGLLASLITSLFSTIITIGMAYFGVTQNGIEIFFGFLFSPVLGYLLDASIGMDAGLRLLKMNFFECVKFALSRLANSSFIRFVVTFLMDMYIAKPLAAVFKGFSIFNLEKVTSSGLFRMLDTFIIRNITSIVQSLVAVITFQTYSNQTRFLWAYPEKSLPKESRVSSYIIMIATSIASVFYLSQYAKEVTSLSLHIVVSILSFFLLTGLYLSRTMEEEYIPVAKETYTSEESKSEESDKPYTNKRFYIGLVLFIFFCIVGIIFPVLKRENLEKIQDMNYTSLNVGKMMRDSITDPITKKVIGLMDIEYESTGKI